MDNKDLGQVGAVEVECLAKEIGAISPDDIDPLRLAEEWCRMLVSVVERKGGRPFNCRYPDKFYGWCHSLKVAAAGHMALEMKRVRGEISAIDWDDGWATDPSGSALEHVCLAMQPGTRWLAHAAGHVWTFAVGTGSFNDVVKASRDLWLRQKFDELVAALRARASNGGGDA
jgi:hypothetical protein